MITFIQEKLPVQSPLIDHENFAKNLVNKSLTNQLQSKLGDNSCELHPDFENEIIVHGYKEDDLMTLKTYCCEKFKTKLEMLVNNQNPFVDK